MDTAGRIPREPRATGPADDPAAGTAGVGSPGSNDEREGPPVEDHRDEEGGSVEEAPAPPAAIAADAPPDYKDQWLRAEAELQNFRRRATREWEEGRRMAEEGVLLEMVAALDDLDRALESARESGASESWLLGVSLVAQRLRDYLARQGISTVDPLGQPFDPAFHEALLEVEAPEGTEPGSVVRVMHKGYRRGDRALRAARVVVARMPAEGR